MKERVVQRKIGELNWRASDEIDSILRDDKKDMVQKKADISSIMDELEAEINNILSGKKSILDKQETKTENNKEGDDEMDFTKISLEDLTKERPDIVKAIEQSFKDNDNLEALTKANEELTARNTDLTTKVEDLTKANEELKTENEELKKKVDEYETRDKKAAKESMIAEKIKETKLPDEAFTDFFKESLMKLTDEEIDKALEDRKELWNKKPAATPKQDEFTPKDSTEEKKSVEDGISTLVEAKK
jgi:hypothetical protein